MGDAPESSRLSIGCGPSGKTGFIGLDADPAWGAAIIAIVPPLPPAVRAQKWDEIEMNHFLACLHPWRALELLRECHQVLAPGGRLVIETPNIAFAAEVLLGMRTPVPGWAPGQCDMWAFYGDPGWEKPISGNHWGYTPATMRNLLIEAGFTNCEFMAAQYHVPERDFRVEAVR